MISKFTAIVSPLPLCLNQDDAIDYLGSPKLFNDMVKAKWIAPAVKRPKMNLYDRKMIDHAWNRIRAGVQARGVQAEFPMRNGNFLFGDSEPCSRAQITAMSFRDRWA